MLKKLFSLALIATLFGAPALMAQEAETIVIVDQDGKRVGAAELNVESDDASGTKIEVKTRGDFKITGDKIIITDENGETKEVDISGARSVSVQRSTKSINDNGNKKTVNSAKAIIIGPDGNKQIIELGNNGGENAMIFGDALPNQFIVGDEPLAMQFFRSTLPGSAKNQQASKFMIGVTCKPVDEALKLHLNLEGGIGLSVESVFEDSPADKAGVETHDILMYAGDQQLTSLQDLSKKVEEAGKEETTVSITAIRKGGEVSFDIKPTERPDSPFMGTLGNDPNVRMQFRQLGPGVIQMPNMQEMPNMPPGMNAADIPQMQRQMEQIRRQMQQIEREMKQQLMRQSDDQADDN